MITGPAKSILVAAALATSAAAAAPTPQRIVSLAPSLTAMALQLGAGSRLAAVTPFCEAPPDVPRIPGGLQPDAEAVLAVNPDLVLVSGLTPETTRRQMRQLGLHVEVLQANTLGEVRAALARLAALLGVPAPEPGPADAPAPRGSALLLFGADTSYSAGRGTHAHEILEAAGLRNIAADADGPWPELGEEFLLAADPDIVLVADYGSADRDAVLARLRAHPLRRHWRAVQSGRVLVLPARAFSVPGPASLQAAGELAKMLPPP